MVRFFSFFILYICFVIVAVWSLPASASWTTNGWSWNGVPVTGTFGSPISACDAIVAGDTDVPVSNEHITLVSGSYKCNWSDAHFSHVWGVAYIADGGSCTPSNVDINTGQCPAVVCTPPQIANADHTACFLPSPGTCSNDLGQVYDDASSSCTTTCPVNSIQMSNECVTESPPKDKNGGQCNVFSPDYVGGVTAADGSVTNVCSNQVQQCQASGGSYGLVNGQPVCVPKDYKPPTCSTGTVNVIPETTSGSYGFACTDAAGNNTNYDSSGNITSSPGPQSPALTSAAQSNLNNAMNPAQGNNANYNLTQLSQLQNMQNQMQALNSKSASATSAAIANGGKLTRIDQDLLKNTQHIDSVTSAINGVNDSLVKGSSSAVASGTAYLTSQPSSLWVSGPFSSVTSQVSNTKYNGDATKNSFTTLFNSIFPQSSDCQPLVFSSGTSRWSMTINCTVIERMRGILAWIIYLFTVYSIFDYLMESNKGK